MKFTLLTLLFLSLFLSTKASSQFTQTAMMRNKLGYFVQTNSAAGYKGSFSGIVGANSACLTQLTTYDWKGKASAGALNSTRVRAFLCDSVTCNNALPNSYYAFARAGFPANGGAIFLTDSLGRGPGDSAAWSGANYFGDLFGYWMGPRSTTSSLYWGTTSSGLTNTHCSNWTSQAGGQSGVSGNASTIDQNRWNDGIAVGCSTVYVLLCLVDPI